MKNNAQQENLNMSFDTNGISNYFYLGDEQFNIQIAYIIKPDCCTLIDAIDEATNKLRCFKDGLK